MRKAPRIMPQLGRIRIGDTEPTSSGKTRPHKLSEFRFTSADESLLHQIASVYGGEVREWSGPLAPKDEHGRSMQFELYTKTNTIEVIIPTLSAATLTYERWSGGGCTLRCTGEMITHCTDVKRVNTPCTCDDDMEDKCPSVLRLNVILGAFSGLGVWRLDTHGYYAAAELQGTLDMLRYGGHEHQMVEAVLRLESRKVKRDGRTNQFVVPVLAPKLTPNQVLIGQRAQALRLSESQKSLEEHVADLYGDGVKSSTLAGMTAADYVPQIEALLHQYGIEWEQCWRAYERLFVKPMDQWDSEMFGILLSDLRTKVDDVHAHIEASQACRRLIVNIEEVILGAGGDVEKFWHRMDAKHGFSCERYAVFDLLRTMLDDVKKHAEKRLAEVHTHVELGLTTVVHGNDVIDAVLGESSGDVATPAMLPPKTIRSRLREAARLIVEDLWLQEEAIALVDDEQATDEELQAMLGRIEGTADVEL